MNNSIILTDDGSNSIFNTDINESYHSNHGAINESHHISVSYTHLTLPTILLV